nr:Chain B, SpaA sorting signal peptide [Corynebacterium diphtheriae]
KNAGFELPLT